MSKQTINIGASPNDGTGTPLRTSFDYTNQNFTELYTAVGPSGNNIVVPGTATITGDLTVKTNVLKVDTTNNRVGIGTASPAVDLHIQSAGSASAEVRLASATRSYNIGSTGSGYGSANNLIIYDLTGAAERWRLDSSGNHFWNNVGGVAGTAMTLNSNGLGVGVSPSYTIHAKKVLSGTSTTVNGLLYLENTGAGNSAKITLTDGVSNNGYIVYSFETGTPTLGLGVGSAQQLVVNSSGNVGIGVTSPSNRLEAQEAGTGGGLGGIVSSTATAGGNAGYVFRTAGTNRWSLSLTGSAGAESIRFYDVNNSATRLLIDTSGNVISNVTGTAPTLATNSQMVFNLTSNTNLRISVRGTDGVTRTANITLA